MNISMIVGRITRDPELKVLPGDKTVCNFGVAVGRKFQKDKTDFFDCVAWGKLGENIATYMNKGREIAIMGRFENEEYTNKEGNKAKSTKLVIDDVKFIGGKAEASTKKDNTFSEIEGELPW